MYLFLDFETYHSSADRYDLRNMSLMEYCRDPRLKVLGVGLAGETDEPRFIPYPKSLEFEGINWEETDVISHNVKFDGFILHNTFGIQPRSWIDTMGMGRACLGNRVSGFSLRTLAEYYGLPSKGTLETDGLVDLTAEQQEALAEYCKHDVFLCREIFNRLNPVFPESQFRYLSYTVQTFVEPRLELNQELLERTVKDEQAKKIKVFEEIGIPKEEFASNQKFAVLLNSKGYESPVKKSPRTGKIIPALSVGDTEFLRLEASGDQKLKQLCEARRAAKSNILETRAVKLAAIAKTGRWAFDVQFSGALQTHRFSGGSGAGGNPQNFPREGALREAVRAPEGYSLIVGDFSSIEMRLVAYLAKEKALTSVIEAGGDVYCDFASSFYGRKITKADETERRFGKTAILGLGYGMGATKFAKTVRLQTGQDISKGQANKAVHLYRMKYSKIPKLWDYLDKRIGYLVGEPFKEHYDDLPVVLDRGCVLLPSGLKLQYPNLRKDGEEWIYDVWQKKGEVSQTNLYGGKLLENIVQALAGEICKEAVEPFLHCCTGLVHDEIHLLVRDEEVKEAKDALYASMTTPPDWLPELCLEAEIGAGKTWAEAKA